MIAQSDKRNVYILLAAILLAGTFLRFYKLDFQSLWHDELHSIIPTAPENSLSSIIDYAKSDQPPAYFVFLHLVFKVFGYNTWLARASAAFLGLASIPVFFFLGQEIKNTRVGLTASLLAAVNYFIIYYSQEARFYSMALLFSALSFLFFIRCYKHGDIWSFVLYIISTAILLYTHYYGIVIFATQALTFLVMAVRYRWGDWRYIAFGLISGLVTGICFIPWMPVIFSDLGIDSFWIQRPTPIFLLEYFYGYVGKDALVSLIFLVFTILYSRAYFTMASSDKLKSVYLIIILWLFISYLIPLTYSLLRQPMLHIRYTIVTLPAWILIFALGWDEIVSRRWKYAILATAALSSVINIFFIRDHYHKIQKQQFREASYAVQNASEEAPVFSNYAWHYNFYFRERPEKVQPLMDLKVSEISRFWLLQAEFFTAQENANELAPYLDEFNVVRTHSFHRTNAVYLERRN
jgi:uncharacterized membrane protein